MKRLVLIVGMCVCSFVVSAQDLKSIFSGVVKSVIGDKLTTAESVVGTWNYSAPECRFESENLLAQAGGEAVSARIEDKVKPIYQKLGLESSVFAFNEEGT